MAVSIYIYLLAWFYGIFTLISAFLILVPNIDRYIFAGWLIFTVWILLRRVSLAIEVFAYTGDKANLRIAWVPPVLLLETFMAIIVATLSPGKINPHFKGVRS
jgi:hypothetical protein